MTSGVVAQQFLIVTALKVLCDIQFILEISDFCYKIVTQKSLLPYQIHGIQLFAEGITAELNGNAQVIKLAISAVVCMQQQHICRACLICFAASGFWRGQFAAPIKLFIGHQRVSVNTAWWLREQCCYRLPPEMLGAVSFMRQEDTRARHQNMRLCFTADKFFYDFIWLQQFQNVWYLLYVIVPHAVFILSKSPL